MLGRKNGKFNETQKFDGTHSANNTTRSYKSLKLIKKSCYYMMHEKT